MEGITFDTEVPEPPPDFLGRVLPGVFRVIPVEVHHRVGVLVERGIPEALDEVVVDEALDVVRAGGNAEHLNRALERDARIEATQRSPEVGQGPARLETILGRELLEMVTDVLITKLPRGSHLLVDVKEEHAASLDLAIEIP